MIDIIGWIGALAFTVCAWPQAIQCWQQGHARGISKILLWIWLAGEVAMLIATPLKLGWISWLMMNYIGNTSALLVIMRYRFFPSE